MKTKVKSREEKLQEQWKKYFKNIEKENDFIFTLLEYYKEIEPKIEKLLKIKFSSEDKDEQDFEYEQDFEDDEIKPTLHEIEEANESILPENLQDTQKCELRYYFGGIKEKIDFYKETIDPKSTYTKKQFEEIIKPYNKYLEILEEIQEQTQKLKPPITQNNFKYLSLENFKGFSKKNNIKIKPITLIYGPNSYGKSSILQSLLLLNQTVNEGKDYKNICLLPNGPMVNLGKFSDFINRHANNKEIKIELCLPQNHYYNKEDAEVIIQDTSILMELSFCFHFALEDEQILLTKIDIYGKYTDYENPDKPIEKEKELLYTLKLNQKSGLYEIKEEKNEILIDTINDKKELKKVSFFKLEEFIVENPFEQLEDIIKNIVYVSSFRTPPERYYVPENNRRVYVGKNGEYTAEILGYDSAVTESVNEWLKKIAGYKLSLGKNESVNSVNLNDEKTDVKNINLIDLGSGIAQVLPIITQAFESKNDMILIEEPEIHLHPKAQADLGEMFKDAAQKRNNTFIIETHSENLLLRLERLIRKGELSKDDVSVIYVDKNKNGSYCIPLILDDEGDIINISEVPDGFFEEGFDELFDISKE